MGAWICINLFILFQFCKGSCCSLRILLFSLLGLPNKKLTCLTPNLNVTILQLLEAIVKNCGDIVHMHVAEKGLLHQMVKMVKKKVIADSEPPLCYFGILPLRKDRHQSCTVLQVQPDFHVKEKILISIDTWQEAFGGPRARYPQYYGAYQELLVRVKCRFLLFYYVSI